MTVDENCNGMVSSIIVSIIHGSTFLQTHNIFLFHSTTDSLIYMCPYSATEHVSAAIVCKPDSGKLCDELATLVCTDETPWIWNPFILLEHNA